MSTPHIDEAARCQTLLYACATVQHVRAAAVRSNYLDFSESWLKQQEVTYHGHPGKPPLHIDQKAQEYFEAAVKCSPPDPDVFGEVIVLGEEAAALKWDSSRVGPTTIMRCDPVDGTSPLAHCGDGFSTVVTAEFRKSPREPWKHLGGAIARGDGSVLSWSRSAVFSHHVVIDLRDNKPGTWPTIELIDQLPPLPNRDIGDEVHRRDIAFSGATVAAHSSKRRALLLSRCANLVTDADFFDFRAGSTSAWPLCNGQLGWVVELNATTIHDSVHLFPFSSLGGKIVDEHFKPINVRELIETYAGPESLEKIIPPYIAYWQEDSLDFIRTRMSSVPARTEPNSES